MPRKTPRPKDEALAIVRSLRGRYISGEAELTAKAAMSRLEAGGGRKAAPSQPTPEKPFTEEERARAKAFLARLKSTYPRPQ
jgi:hypothetical protein